MCCWCSAGHPCTRHPLSTGHPGDQDTGDSLLQLEYLCLGTISACGQADTTAIMAWDAKGMSIQLLCSNRIESVKLTRRAVSECHQVAGRGGSRRGFTGGGGAAAADSRAAAPHSGAALEHAVPSVALAHQISMVICQQMACCAVHSISCKAVRKHNWSTAAGHMADRATQSSRLHG
jgi:hypothetical protein